jgi:hypothetical protein
MYWSSAEMGSGPDELANNSGESDFPVFCFIPLLLVRTPGNRRYRVHGLRFCFLFLFFVGEVPSDILGSWHQAISARRTSAI